MTVFILQLLYFNNFLFCWLKKVYKTSISKDVIGTSRLRCAGVWAFAENCLPLFDVNFIEVDDNLLCFKFVIYDLLKFYIF